MKHLVFLLVLLVSPAMADAPKTPWFASVQPMIAEHIDFGIGLGMGYRFCNGVTVAVQGQSMRLDSFSGTATGEVDFDDYYRWPPVQASIPYRIPSQTIYGASVVITIPLGK